jgi:hypothetical protein
MGFRCFIRSPLTLPSAVIHYSVLILPPLSSFLPPYIVTKGPVFLLITLRS